MLNKINIIIGLLLLLIQAQAQTLEKPFFYQISKDDNKAYILGTIHTGFGLSALPSYVSNKILDADTLVLESDLEAAQEIMQQKYPLPCPAFLKSLLSDNQWLVLLTQLAPLGVTEEKLEGFYPFIASSLLSLVQLPQVEDAMDATISALAKKNSKPLDYLESAESALTVLEQTLGLEALKAMLDMTSEEITLSTDVLIKAYVSGDEEALLASMKEDKTLSEDGFNLLIKNRNKAWIPQINRIFKNDGVEFFAFGAGHLGGTQGVLSLLRAEGYKVERISN